MNPAAAELPIHQTAPLSEVQGMRFGRRAVAYIVDMLIVNVANSIVGLVGVSVFLVILYVMASLVGYEPVLAEPSTIVNLALGILISFAYFISFETICGATLGKLMLGMRVTTLRGDRPPLDAAAIRAFWRLLDGLFLGLVAAASMAPPLRQRFGDKHARTLVVASASPLLTYTVSVQRFFAASFLYLSASLLIQIFLFLAYSTFRPIP